MSADAPGNTPLPQSLPGWLPYLWGRVLFPGSSDPVTRVRLLSLALVVLLPALLLYPCRSFLLLEPDEGRYAQIPKEMLDSGDWVVPTLQGEAYLDKPPLMYWLVTLSYQAFGISEASARLVPAICVHLTILAVYLIGRRSIGERAAFWAAMLLTIAPGFISVARLILLDGLLTMCVTLSVLCGFEAVRTGRLKVGWWVASAVASGLGFLTKGPISEVLLFVPLFAFAWLNGTTARVGWKALAAFLGIVLAVNLPWYIAIYLRQPEFLGYFFWEHNIMRFVKPFDHLQPVWYYVPILLGGFLPGVILAVPYVHNLLFGNSESAENRSQAGGFWLLAGLWCVAFFSVSGSKLPTYILPAFPPLCLALGWPLRWLARRPDPDRPIRRLLIIKCFGLGSITLIGTAIGALRRHHPGIEITFVTFEEHRALLRMMDSGMRVWTVRKSSLTQFAADSLRLAGRLAAAPRVLIRHSRRSAPGCR